MILRIAALLATLAISVTAGAETARDAGLRELSHPVPATKLCALDIKMLRRVTAAHAQLERWADNLLARLERGLGPRQSDPLLDGRARFELQKLRMTYAGAIQSSALAHSIIQLADHHEKRLQALETMLVYGVDRRRFAATSAELHRAIGAVRSLDQPGQ